MKRKMLSTVVLICLAAAVQARLGDSFKQSISRFGKPLGHFKDKYAEAALFEYKNYAVFVRYRYNKSFEETYAYLAPGVKDKLKKVEEWIDCFEIINNPKNLEPLNEKQRGMLRSANLKASWIMGKIKGNGIEEMFAVLGKRKVTGDYNIAKKFLVITETNVPELKVSPEEIAQAKAVCLPLGTKYEEYKNLLGEPYEVNSATICFFLKNNFTQEVKFNNTAIDLSIKQNIIDKSLLSLPRTMGGKSSKVVYMMPMVEEIKKATSVIKNIKQLHFEYAKRKQLGTDEYCKMEAELAKIDVAYCPNKQLSIPSKILNSLLTSTTNTIWSPIDQKDINIFRLSTWKDGRKLYAEYDVIIKYLTIEYGYAPADYKPDVIKKLKEKKATEALEGF